MRKQIMKQEPDKAVNTDGHSWFDLEHMACIELSSEDDAHPIESAVIENDGNGWKAAEPGEQTIRIVFDEPQSIRRIRLLFREREQERTQEFLLRWLPVNENSFREIVRQQYNFSPPFNTEELEDYAVNIDAVQVLELCIKPDINGGGALASLARLQLS